MNKLVMNRLSTATSYNKRNANSSNISLATFSSCIRLTQPSSAVNYDFARNKIKGKINKHINSGMILNDSQIKQLNIKYHSFDRDCHCDNDSKEHNDNKKKNKKKRNIITSPKPNLLHSEKNASRYEDYYITPKELITNKLNKHELKIVYDDPSFFGFRRLVNNIEAKEENKKNLSDILNEEERWESKRLDRRLGSVTKNILKRLSIYEIKGLDIRSSSLKKTPQNNNNCTCQVRLSNKALSPKCRTNATSFDVKPFNLSPQFYKRNHCNHHYHHSQILNVHHCKHERKLNEMNERVEKMKKKKEEQKKECRSQCNQKLILLRNKIKEKNISDKFILTTLALLKRNYTSNSNKK